MKLNKFFMLGLVGLAFTACSNDDDAVNGGNEDGKVRITLSLGRTETVRSLGPTAAGLYNTITDLDVVFYNNANAYVEAPETVAEDTEYSKAGEIAKAVSKLASDHTATLTLKGIPASAAKVYIVANQNGKSHQVDISSLDAAKNTLIYLNDQVIDDYNSFSGEESHMTGLASIGTDNSVNVELRAVPSRIELQNVNAVPVPTGETWGGAQITSFTVLGFYVNAFYTNGHLDPTIDENNSSSRQKIDGESVVSNYDTAESGTGLYKASTWGFMCDEPTDGQITYATGTFDEEDNPTGTLYTAAPVPATNYWGYHILQGDVPHVVVKLNVVYDDNTTAVKFLTINKYTYAGNFTEPNNGPVHNQGDPVDKVLRGHVYRISNINFDVADLTDVPYEGTKTVSASVSVLPWVGVEVNPGFN